MKNNQLRLIEVFGESCANCYAVYPVVKDAAQQLHLQAERWELSHMSKEQIQKYAIQKIPTVLLLDGEKELAKCTGYQPLEILMLWIEAKLEEYQIK